MPDFRAYAREGVIAGVSVGAISGAWSAIIAPVLYNYLISSLELSVGFLIQYAVASGISGAISGSIFGCMLALGLMLLTKKGMVEENRLSSIKYGITVSIILTSISAYAVFSSSIIELIPMIAFISLAFIHGIIFFGLWGHWIGRSLYEEY